MSLTGFEELVVKPVDGSGRQGPGDWPGCFKGELDALRKRVLADPRGWIAQPVLQLSTVPTLSGDKFGPRHVDLRPFAVNDGDDVWVLPGGLTRVALKEGLADRELYPRRRLQGHLGPGGFLATARRELSHASPSRSVNRSRCGPSKATGGTANRTSSSEPSRHAPDRTSIVTTQDRRRHSQMLSRIAESLFGSDVMWSGPTERPGSWTCISNA